MRERDQSELPETELAVYSLGTIVGCLHENMLPLTLLR